MNRTLSVEYEVVNGRGQCVYTSSDPDLARREARRRIANGEAVKVDAVTLTQTRTRFFRPRPAAPTDLAIPPCPVVRMGARA